MRMQPAYSISGDMSSSHNTARTASNLPWVHADSLWLSSAFYSPFSQTSKQHTHIEHYGVEKARVSKSNHSSLLLLYFLLTDHFYNIIIHRDKRLGPRHQTHRSDCASVIRETLATLNIWQMEPWIYTYLNMKTRDIYWNVRFNAAAALELVFNRLQRHQSHQEEYGVFKCKICFTSK